jgi:hypothetical protein
MRRRRTSAVDRDGITILFVDSVYLSAFAADKALDYTSAARQWSSVYRRMLGLQHEKVLLCGRAYPWEVPTNEMANRRRNIR